ncbi:hemolysin family protein [Bacteroidota bacterium]
MNSNIVEILFFVLFIILAGFLKAAEIAISSIGDNKIEELKEKQNKTALLFERIHDDSESFFGSLQVLYTTVTIVSGLIGIRILGRYAILISDLTVNLGLLNNPVALLAINLIIVTSVIVIFCLLIPRAVGVKYSIRLATKSVRNLLTISALMKFPVNTLTAISNLILLPFKEKASFAQSRPSEDEILNIISDGVKSGAIDETEQEIIENVLEFNDLRANEVMIPRTEMIAVDITNENDVIAKEIIQSGHSLIPVFDGNPDNIIGVIHTKDMMRLFVDGQPVLIKQFLRPAYFIPESKTISKALKEMQQIGERLAIVIDEYGGTEGIITVEDILEEIVGEIKDKTRVEKKELSRFADGTFCILGSMDINDFNKSLSPNLPESEEYNTVAGFIAEKTGKILNLGESFEFQGIHFKLIKKIRQKMVQFKVYSDPYDLKDKE